MSAPSTTSEHLGEMPEGRRHEVLGIVSGATTVLMALSLVSYDALGGDNWVGPVGSGIASVLASAFGVGAWVLPVELGLMTTRLFSRRNALLGLATLASTLVIVLVFCAMLHLGLAGQQVFGGHLPGGVIGEVLGEVLRSLLGLAGAYVVGVSILLITLVLRTPVSIAVAARRALGATRRAVTSAHDGVTTVLDAWREARELEAAEREALRKANEPRIVQDRDEDEDEALDEEASLEAEDEDEEPAPPPAIKKARGRAPAKGRAKAAPPPALEDDEADAEDEDEDEELEDDPVLEDEPDTFDEEPEEAPARRKRRAKEPEGPKIVAPVANRAPTAPTPGPDTVVIPSTSAQQPFVSPPTTLLEETPDTEIEVDAETLKANAVRLTEKLAAYGVKGRVDEIHPGPVVTMYEFEPQSGTKISKIAGLADDLAMALAAQKVRIVAPIPGKARVGFELPNDDRKTVHLRGILEDPRWENHKGSLPIALGKDIAGQPVYGDLSKMPHLLVAGATGSGKSVGLNVMLTSLLMKKSPEDVRMLMIDPKVVELAVFDGIPHMLLPVVTDMNKAALALKWAVDEMERRYQLFADAGARNITTYNKRVEKVLTGELSLDKLMPSRAGKVRALGPDGEEVLLDPSEDEASDALDTPPARLPYVVVVVDEFADLMMVAAKDVEACIARLAQKARAAGIHVILATQRPSVDVITGMIKANFPSRIAFKVTARQDSSTILGRIGAEHLLGMGDMLMIPPGSSDLKRVHSAFISEEEVKQVCDFLRAQGKPQYDTEILKPRDEGDGDDFSGPKSDDPLYDKAVAVVAQAGYCSISHIQRQLSVGYNKAAKLVDRMEAEGVVGPATGKAGGRREVLVQPI